MLPDRLQLIRDHLIRLSSSDLTQDQRALLLELDELSRYFDRNEGEAEVRDLSESLEGITLRMSGPSPRVCPSCGRAW